MDQLVDGYLAHLKVERGLSVLTVEGYAQNLTRFAALLDREGIGLADVDTGTVAAFLISLSKAGLSARSQTRYLSALRGFFRYLVLEKELKKNPAVLLESPKLSRRLPTVLSKDEVLRLLAAPGAVTRIVPVPQTGSMFGLMGQLSRIRLPSSRRPIRAGPGLRRWNLWVSTWWTISSWMTTTS